MSGAAFDRVVHALESIGSKVRTTGEGRASAQCPAHEDRNPSLSVTRIEGLVLIYCHAGCDTESVLDKLGLAKRDLYDDSRGARYNYADQSGIVVRTVSRTPDKAFRQSNITGNPTLYRLPEVVQAITDRKVIYLVEGEKDVHALESIGVVATTAPMGATNFAKVDTTPLHGAQVVAVVDNDDAGKKWATFVRDKLDGHCQSLTFVQSAAGKDAADHIAAGHSVDDFVSLESAEETPVMTLAGAHEVFVRWLGKDYDLDALNATLATAAVERLDGDPIWLLIISGSGNAKTETVQALDGIQATITSTISSHGALLSATSKRDKTKDATGGLLRKMGSRGVLVIKDVTSVLSMGRDMRAEVLGALREVYDGRWSRNVGTDGGRTLDWTGRIVVIGAVTTKWDQAHDVIASMGDRFVLVRMDSTTGRQTAGRKAIGNTGSEIQMRAELAEAVAGVMAGMCTVPATVSPEETDVLLAAADIVTKARTGVEYDYRGDVIDAHAPEMPTRFAKQLTQVLRGGVAIGMDRSDACRLAMRCACDSMPPMRLAIIDDVAANPRSSTADVRKRLGKPRATVDRQLQALHMLGVLEVEEEERERAGKPATVWKYSLAEDIDWTALNAKSVPDLSVHTPSSLRKEESEESALRVPIDISGTDPECLARGELRVPELFVDGDPNGVTNDPLATTLWLDHEMGAA